MNRAEKNLKRLLQFWIGAFSISTLIFALEGDALFHAFNRIGANLSPSLLPIPPSQEKFWLALALSLMVTLIFLCFMAQKDVRRHLGMIQAILVSKFASTLFFFLFFIFSARLSAYFMGMLTDGSVFLITFYFYRRFKKVGAES